MALKWIGSAWKSAIETSFPPQDRFYVDFRQKEYPPVAGNTDAYTLVGDTALLRWPLDDISGGVTPDLSGNGYDGTISGSPVSYSPGRAGDCVRFTSTGQYVARVVSCGSVVTISWWYDFFAFNSNNYDVMISVNPDAAPGGIVAAITPSAIDVGNYSAGRQILGAPNPGAGWHHYVMVMTASLYSLYIDGALAGTSATNIVDPTTTGGYLFVNHSSNLGTSYDGIGWADEVRLCNRALSLAEVQYLYEYPVGIVPNLPGSHSLTSGTAKYCITLPSTVTVEAYIKPNFSYTVATDQIVWDWTYGASSLELIYLEASDQLAVAWVDGGTQRFLILGTFTSDAQLQVWMRVTCCIDLTTGTTTGSGVYIDSTLKDSTWSGNIDAMASEFPFFQVNASGGYSINFIRMFPGVVASSTEVSNGFSATKDEEIFWSFDGFGTGRTRCNVTSKVLSMTHNKAAQDIDTGALTANKLGLLLNSNAGEFADDQYATFDAANEVYNGTSAQKYMQSRCRVEAETWYSGLFEPYFRGRVDGNYFRRRTQVGSISAVTIDAEDIVSDIARKIVAAAVGYDGKKISDATESNSLVHLIGRLGTQHEVKNYLGNSGFENATISNSWAVTGTGGTLTRTSGGLIGTYYGAILYGSATADVKQTVTFTGKKKLNVGEVWTFSIYLKSAGALSDTIGIAEYNGGTLNDTESTTTYTLSGGEGWVKYEVSHTIADSTSDRLKVRISVAAAGTLQADAAMLIQDSRSANWDVLNATDGASAIISADSYASSLYDSCGFDIDAVDITDTYAVVEEGDIPWDHLTDIAKACAAYYMGADPAGTLKFRSPFKTSYTDPTPSETIALPAGVDTQLTLAQANRIIVKGVYIVKNSNEMQLWDAQAAGLFSASGDSVSVANGDQFPDPTTYGDLWAKYGE